jgi:hypothetical protein
MKNFCRHEKVNCLRKFVFCNGVKLIKFKFHLNVLGKRDRGELARDSNAFVLVSFTYFLGFFVGICCSL